MCNIFGKKLEKNIQGVLVVLIGISPKCCEAAGFMGVDYPFSQQQYLKLLQNSGGPLAHSCTVGPF